ncbi:3-oxoadipyl-CoA thiolase [Croceifilum oryzae]|uniref:acetyl-CoA C-acyltransferase n=1 Tax=Croceifilum oryzae TaxID=1553429 RepID=A0AAJ1TI98_9BACL|nr:thiolase family protein [Croceifilum oryzae]MDQ0416646.1 3-oxoadipyl-CoA thiolase [Croceifilum oryzae]
MREVVIVDAVRSPIGKARGSLSTVRADDLAAYVIQALLERNPELDPLDVTDVMLGCANQAGEDNRNVARMSSLLAGLPYEVPGTTVNRLCGSGMEAIIQAAHLIQVGAGQVVIAGGVESMSRAPLVMLKPDEGMMRGNQSLVDTTLGWRFLNPKMEERFYPYSMGETAENVAKRYHVSRQEQDEFAYLSHQKATQAWKEERFASQIIPIPTKKKGEKTDKWVNLDEQMRPDTSIDRLSTLKAVFREGGTVTAGNSAGMNDGASVLLLMEKEYALRHGFRPMARFVQSAVAGVHPDVMGIGPVPATQKALQKAGLRIPDINWFEVNEAFATQAIACIRELQISFERVNPLGGSIALGHPLGASGARIVTTLIHQLVQESRSGAYGVATMCIGVGQGISMIVQSM